MTEKDLLEIKNFQYSTGANIYMKLLLISRNYSTQQNKQRLGFLLSEFEYEGLLKYLQAKYNPDEIKKSLELDGIILIAMLYADIIVCNRDNKTLKLPRDILFLEYN